MSVVKPEDVFAAVVLSMLCIFATTTHSILQCKKKKKKRKRTTMTPLRRRRRSYLEYEEKRDYGDKPNLRDRPGTPKVKAAGQVPTPPAKLKIRPPTKDGMVQTFDPNYQTLAGMNPDAFGQDRAKGAVIPGQGPKAPAVGGMAATHDPNYQTLCNLDQGIFGADKAVGAGGQIAVGGPRPPDKVGMVGTFDPNYQTLAGLDQNLAFGADKKIGGGTPRAPKQNADKKAGAFDPNYMTLAGLDNNEMFKEKRGGGTPRAPSRDADKKVGLQSEFLSNSFSTCLVDPNYMTLAALDNNIFGADKKK